MRHRHLINAKTFKVTPNVFCFSPTCETTPGTCLTTDVFDGPYGGKRMLVTSMSLGQVRSTRRGPAGGAVGWAPTE